MGHKSKRSKRWIGIDGGRPRQFVPLPACLPTAAPSDADRFFARHEELRFRIASNCKVQIQFNGKVTQSAIKKLIDYLEMSVGEFPKDDDVSPVQG